MQELHLVGFTTDRRHLIFSSRQGAKSGSFLVPVDEELLDAVEGLSADRAGTDDVDEFDEEVVAPAADTRVDAKLSVREVQARLRAGAAVEEIAARAEVDPAWVERFAPPIRAEQQQIVSRALATRMERPRTGTSAVTLREAVSRSMAERDLTFTAESFASAWSSRLVGADLWSIEFTFSHRSRRRTVAWTFEADEDRLTTSDRLASQIGFVAGEASSSPAESRRPSTGDDDRPSGAGAPAKKAKKKSSAKKKSAKKKSAKKKPSTTKKSTAKKKAPAPGKRTTARKKSAPAASRVAAARKDATERMEQATAKRVAAARKAAQKKSVATSKDAGRRTAADEKAAAREARQAETQRRAAEEAEAETQRRAAEAEAETRRRAAEEAEAETRREAEEAAAEAAVAKDRDAARAVASTERKLAEERSSAARDAAERAAAASTDVTPDAAPGAETDAEPAPTVEDAERRPDQAVVRLRAPQPSVPAEDPAARVAARRARAAERSVSTAQFRSGSAVQAASAPVNGAGAASPEGVRRREPPADAESPAGGGDGRPRPERRRTRTRQLRAR